MSPRQPKSAPAIPDAELALLKALWDGGPATVRELLDRLGSDQAYTTVQTLLGRLVDKGLVRTDRKELAHVFTATVARDELAQQQVQQVASSLLDGAIAPLVLRLVEQGRFSAAEIDRCRELLAAAERKDAAAGGKAARRGGRP
jgi:BlaI family transcriptional regulator, penicillinase repressor